MTSRSERRYTIGDRVKVVNVHDTWLSEHHLVGKTGTVDVVNPIGGRDYRVTFDDDALFLPVNLHGRNLAPAEDDEDASPFTHGDRVFIARRARWAPARIVGEYGVIADNDVSSTLTWDHFVRLDTGESVYADAEDLEPVDDEDEGASYFELSADEEPEPDDEARVHATAIALMRNADPEATEQVLTVARTVLKVTDALTAL